MKKIALLALTVAALGAVSACNTIEGVGKDVSSAARGVKDAMPDSVGSSSSNSSGSYDSSVQSSSY